MRIDDLSRVPQTAAPGEPAKPIANPLQIEAPPPRVDEGDLSPVARSLQTDDRRLQALRESLQTGAYEVTASLLADDLIKSHLEP
jgi:hypothetical protein